MSKKYYIIGAVVILLVVTTVFVFTKNSVPSDGSSILLDACNDLKSQNFDSSECYTRLAVWEQSDKRCSFIPDDFQREGCTSSVSRAKDYLSSCLSTYSGKEEESCYFGYINFYTSGVYSLDFCEHFSDSVQKISCSDLYYRFLKEQNEEGIEVCGKFSTIQQQDTCFLGKAQNARDIKICDYVSDTAGLQTYCKQQLQGVIDSQNYWDNCIELSLKTDSCVYDSASGKASVSVSLLKGSKQLGDLVRIALVSNSPYQYASFDVPSGSLSNGHNTYDNLNISFIPNIAAASPIFGKLVCANSVVEVTCTVK